MPANRNNNNPNHHNKKDDTTIDSASSSSSSSSYYNHNNDNTNNKSGGGGGGGGEYRAKASNHNGTPTTTAAATSHRKRTNTNTGGMTGVPWILVVILVLAVLSPMITNMELGVANFSMNNNNKALSCKQEKELSEELLLLLDQKDDDDNDDDAIHNDNDIDNDTLSSLSLPSVPHTTRNNETYLREEGVLWMWFYHTVNNDIPPPPSKFYSHLKDLLLSVWSVKTNSNENFHTTLLCDETIYQVLLNLPTPLYNMTRRLLDHVQIFNATEYLITHFHPKSIKPMEPQLYLEKCLLGQLSPYYRTLFLDLDVLVIEPTYVRTMLNFVSDHHHHHHQDGDGDNDDGGGFDIIQPQVWWNRKEPWTNKLPVGCTCIIAFQNSPATLALMDEWVKVSYLHEKEKDRRKGKGKGNKKDESTPHTTNTTNSTGMVPTTDPITTRPNYVKRDQELLWWTLMKYRPRDLKYFQLPMEYQCPLSKTIGDFWTYRTLYGSHKAEMDTFNQIPCKVIHSHAIVEATQNYYCTTNTTTTTTTTTTIDNDNHDNNTTTTTTLVDVCQLLTNLKELGRSSSSTSTSTSGR